MDISRTFGDNHLESLKKQAAVEQPATFCEPV
jgi:hypothetical protein